MYVNTAITTVEVCNVRLYGKSGFKQTQNQNLSIFPKKQDSLPPSPEPPVKVQFNEGTSSSLYSTDGSKQGVLDEPQNSKREETTKSEGRQKQWGQR